MPLAANALSLLALLVLSFADVVFVVGLGESIGLETEEPADLAIVLLLGLTVLGFAAVVVPGEAARTKLASGLAVGCLAFELFPLSSLWFILLPVAVLAGGSAILRTRRPRAPEA